MESCQDLIRCNGPDFVTISRQILNRGSYLRFEAKGHCMHPFIQDRDIILVEPAEFSHLRLGEIVLYQISDEVVLAHRIVGRMQRYGTNYLLTRGDAAWGLDSPVSPSQILGRITVLERRGRLIRVDCRGRRLLGLAHSNGRALYHRTRGAFGRLAARGTTALGNLVRRATG